MKTKKINCVYGVLAPNGRIVRVGETTNLYTRKITYKSHANVNYDKDYNSPFSQCIREHGFENFTFIVLELLCPSLSKQERYKREDYWSNYYDTVRNGFNITSSGTGAPSGPNHHRRGQKLSENHKKKISDKIKGSTRTEKTKKRISDSKKDEKHPHYRHDLKSSQIYYDKYVLKMTYNQLKKKYKTSNSAIAKRINDFTVKRNANRRTLS